MLSAPLSWFTRPWVVTLPLLKRKTVPGAQKRNQHPQLHRLTQPRVRHPEVDELA